MKKKLYFFQVNYSYGNAAHLPYTAGQLVAYAFDDKDVAKNYELENIFFLRENADKIMVQIDEPFIVAFSSYIWNFNFNKAVAKRIKEKYPDCTIVFGGHHVTPGGDLLNECSYIDYLLHGEGEIIFRRLLRALIGLDKAETIPGISMRTKSGIITTPEKISTECNFPSPYINGYFDKIIKENPEKEFLALIETTRGCPNSCSYCDWSNMKSRIRKFPLERVYGEIEWIAKNEIYGMGTADSNFGIFGERDIEITKTIIKSKKETGYPVKLQTSYAKNSNDTVFKIGQMLEENQMSKGITLSFQSMNDEVLKNISRQNISIAQYSELMSMYNKAGIATYTELILGLPGETYESLVDGIDRLLNLGQHNAIYVHNCEQLPCSVMAQKDYENLYSIKTSHIPLNQPHREFDEEDDIPEYSSIVTSTYSMTNEDWKKMNLFSAIVQSCHNMGLLQFFALYLYNEGFCSYKHFYTSLLDFALSEPQTVIGKIFCKLTTCLDNVLKEKGTLSCGDERFGKILWPLEEYAFLCAAYELEEFYSELTPFLKSFGIENEIFDDLMIFQKNMPKQPFAENITFSVSYNFVDYFLSLLSGEKIPFTHSPCTVNIKTKPFSSWEEYARIVAWFGRKDSNSTYIKLAKI